MTYLQLVNGVLRRMREDEVASVAETTYSAMIGDFVNDARRIVENSYAWGELRNTYTITTVADTFSYALTGAGNDVTTLRFLNDTNNVFMQYRPQAWFDNMYLLNNAVSGSPTYYTYNGVDSNGDLLIDVYPNPDGVYTLRYNCVDKQTDLSDDADKLLVPALPVLHLALGLAARERGETGGTSVAEYFQIADRYLSDAIQNEAARHPEEMIYRVV